MVPATDWPALLPDVARRLLGDPPRTEHGGDTWRYRTRGSLAVHVGGDRRGTWHDFEADQGGGTLALVQHVLQCDKAAAVRWLEAEGLITSSNGARPSPLPGPAPAPPVPRRNGARPRPWRPPSWPPVCPRTTRPPAPTWPTDGLGHRSGSVQTCRPRSAGVT